MAGDFAYVATDKAGGMLDCTSLIPRPRMSRGHVTFRVPERVQLR